jgi:hypothetical protein
MLYGPESFQTAVSSQQSATFTPRSHRVSDAEAVSHVAFPYHNILTANNVDEGSSGKSFTPIFIYHLQAMHFATIILPCLYSHQNRAKLQKVMTNASVHSNIMPVAKVAGDISISISSMIAKKP